MTIDPGTVGPPSPHRGSAGLLRDGWRYYAPGDEIRCLAMWVDRRAEVRGVERRREPRPCPHTWGRVGPGDGIWVRLVRSGNPPAPTLRAALLMMPCKTHHCHKSHEFLILTVAAEAA